MSLVDLVFTGPPGARLNGQIKHAIQNTRRYADLVAELHDVGNGLCEFVGIEGQDGDTIEVGDWHQREDGRWVLRVEVVDPEPEPSTDLDVYEPEPVEATAIAGPEPWVVVIFPPDHSTGRWRDRKASALQDMEEGELEGIVVKATSGQDAIRKVYDAKLDEIRSKRRGHRDRDQPAEFTDADGHYFASPLFRPETEQAVLTGQWATNMELLA